MEWRRESFWLTDDADRLDMDYIVAALQASYWAPGRPREIIETSFRNSLGFGLFDGERPIGFSRVITDRVIFSWICDVWVDPAYRGRGLGQWMMQCVMEHPDVALTRMALATRDAHAFYEKLGFERRELLARAAKRPYR